MDWRVSNSRRPDIAVDALAYALYERGVAESERLIHHSGRGSQYLAIRYTPGAWPRPVSSRLWAAPVIRMITRWPNPSLGDSRLR